jgi:capsular polysaccharide transport system permease protein
MTSFIVTFRVIFALMLREARVRHGRSRLGYSWSIIEPALLISALTTIFTMVRGQSGSAHDFAIFFATGVLPFQYFRNTTQFVSTAFDMNQPLFNYPPVKPLDAVIARTLLEFATQIIVIALVLGFQIAVLGADPPYNLPGILLVVCLITLFGFGAGLNLAIGRRQIPSVGNIYLILMGPAFFVSAVFYSLSSVPTIFREILVWNPLVHVVEGFRSFYFPGYPTQDVHLMYPFWWALSLAFVGVLRDRIEKRGQM